jgi:hypothetical protein
MGINLHIDRIVLENIDLSPRQQRHLQAVIESELTWLLTVQGLPPNCHYSNASPSLPIATIASSLGASPAVLGHQIAQNIYQAMGGQVGG